MPRGFFDSAIVLAFCAVIFAVIAAVGTSIFGGFYPNYSDGFRVGAIQKTSTKGLLWCKSTEGELVLDSFRGRQMSQDSPYRMDNLWAFSVVDPAVVADLNEYSGARVKLRYRQWFIKPWCHHTVYEITKVEPAT